MAFSSVLPAFLCLSWQHVAASSVISRSSRQSAAISLTASPPTTAGKPFEHFVSYSIEFSSFPDFAGNLSAPNTFSNNLLDNIAAYSAKPYIRVGGNTEDFAVFDPSLEVAEVGIVNSTISPDYPTTLTIGPAYFESYQTWPGVKFIHGFNQGKNSTAERIALLESVPYACEALRGRLAYWEFGNEPDLFRPQGARRPADWKEPQYVAEWLKWTRAIRAAMKGPCPDLATDAEYKYIAPSFAGSTNSLETVIAFEDGLDTDKDIALTSFHNYMSGADVLGVTLQGTLMNHSNTVASVAKLLNQSNILFTLPQSEYPAIPVIIGETNSLYHQGRPGLSNVWGAALWGIDFNLWCAANNIHRVHMHQGTNYRYQAWQPIDTNITAIGTKAPYYGSITVAAFLGNVALGAPSILNLPLANERESAYASYINGKLAKIIIINMMEYNGTAGNNLTDAYPRPIEDYTFQLPKGYRGKVALQRALANGSDAITGITFDGYSYNYELDNGLPVLLSNVTRGESVTVGRSGRLTVSVPRSSALIMSFGRHAGGYRL